MKKKILKTFLTFVLLLPCLLLFSACGEIKSLDGETLVFSKLEVTGALVKEDYENSYKTISFKFDENTVTHIDGGVETVYDYKLENGKVYIKGDESDYSETPYELSGKYMIVTETYDEGTVKVYFKIK